MAYKINDIVKELMNTEKTFHFIGRGDKWEAQAYKCVVSWKPLRV